MYNKFDERGKVICQECGKSFLYLTQTHLRLHSMTCDDYKKKFPDFPFVSEVVKTKMKYSKSSVLLDSKECITDDNDCDMIHEDLPVLEEHVSKPKEISEDMKAAEYEGVPKSKVDIIKFLKKVFPNVVNNYLISKTNSLNVLDFRIFTDISDPTKKIVFDFPNAFWHVDKFNLMMSEEQKLNRLKQLGWTVVRISSPVPTVDDVQNQLVNMKLI